MSSYIIAVLAVAIAISVVLFGCKRSNEQERNRIGVREALAEILSSAPPGHSGGFVIFEGKRDLDYVQYALDPNGLLLYWPSVQEGRSDKLPLFWEYLRAKGYERVSPIEGDAGLREQVMALQRGQCIILDDGLYCQAGRDEDELRAMTLGLMKEVFGITDENEIKSTVEVEG